MRQNSASWKKGARFSNLSLIRLVYWVFTMDKGIYHNSWFQKGRTFRARKGESTGQEEKVSYFGGEQMNSKESSLEERMQEEMDRFEDDPEYRAEGYYLEVTEKVLKRMSQEGISRAELARRMDCSKSHITQLFQGVTNITLETLAKLAVSVNANGSLGLSTESSAQVLGMKLRMFP